MRNRKISAWDHPDLGHNSLFTSPYANETPIAEKSGFMIPHPALIVTWRADKKTSAILQTLL